MREARRRRLCNGALGVAALSLVLPAGAAAQEQQSATWLQLGGLLFGDVYHIASHHTEESDGATGAVLRRGYLTFDVAAEKKWFGRLRFELNQAGTFETYDFTFNVKDLYVGRRIGGHRLLAGKIPTPTFDAIEAFWGMRYLMRTPLDLQGVASRDVGISAAGPLSGDGSLSYRAALGAGTNFGNETGDGRKIMGAFAWRPDSAWYVELYADYERLPGPADRRTLQAFVGRRTSSWRWGLQYANQDRQEDPPLRVGSAFVVARLKESINLVGRVDRLFEPSPKGDAISYVPFDPTARATLMLGAVDVGIGSHVRLSPNTVVIAYDRNDAGVRPRTDVQLRLSLFVNYE